MTTSIEIKRYSRLLDNNALQDAINADLLNGRLVSVVLVEDTWVVFIERHHYQTNQTTTPYYIQHPVPWPNQPVSPVTQPSYGWPYGTK